jgi:hypothetical protein
MREYIGQHRKHATGADDRGWYAVKREDFRREAISAGLRNRATRVGVNLEFGGGKVAAAGRLREPEDRDPGKSTGLLITQLQVKY